MFGGCNRLQVPARQEEPTWSCCTRMTLPGNPEVLEIRLVFSSIFFVCLFDFPFDWPVMKTSVKTPSFGTDWPLWPCCYSAILRPVSGFTPTTCFLYGLFVFSVYIASSDVKVLLKLNINLKQPCRA
jgi:hypothetical protein